jgi:hypothetical protein
LTTIKTGILFACNERRQETASALAENMPLLTVLEIISGWVQEIVSPFAKD